MASRRHIPSAYERRSAQASATGHHDQLPSGYRPSESFSRPELLENKLAVQAEEIDRLAGDNHKLAATHVALREDFVIAQEEIRKLKEHIRSIQAESDVQIRVLLDKIAKIESNIRAGESVKKELQEAHIQVRSLVVARRDLNSQIQKASQELENARADIKKLPEMLTEVDSLREEHRRLRKTFEYEKSSNMDKVEQMRRMEKDLVGMAREVERLREEVLNAEKRANDPNAYNGPYANPGTSYPPPSIGGYVAHHNGPYAQLGVGSPLGGRIQYSNGTRIAVPGGVGAPGVSSNSSWQVAYDNMHAPR